MKTLIIPAVLFIFFSSCSMIKPAAPNLPLSQINAAPLPDSRIDVPVTIDLTSVFNDFTVKIPTGFSGEGQVGPGEYKWSIQRQPFNLSLSGYSLNIIDAAHCNAAGYLKNPLNHQLVKLASCEVDATIGISASFNLQNDYSLSANASLTQFDLSPCELKVANLNIAPILKPKAVDTINQALTGLNESLSKYNFKSLLQPGWTALGQPIKIADIGYIVLNPSQVSLAKPSGSGNFLNFSAGITAKPDFYLANPGKVTVNSLPDISTGTGDGGFYLNMDVHLDYKPLNDILKNNISDKRIRVAANGYIDIQDAGIYGTGNNHLLIKVKFYGKQGLAPYHGILYFTCIPQYDINTGNFYINEINFDVNTIDKLKEGPAAWILTAAVKKILGQDVHFNVAGQVNGVKDKLSQSLNRRIGSNIVLSGRVDSLRLQGILPEKDFILVRVSTSGNLAVKVN